MTKAFPTLKNPPIVEAVIAFRFSRSKPLTLEEINSEAESFRFRYPSKDELRMASFQVPQEKDKAPTVSPPTTIGLKLTSKDKLEVLQLRTDIFTYSRLEPYSNWPVFSKEFRNLWEQHIKFTSTEVVHGIGLRFINYMKLPTTIENVGDFLNLAPSTAGDFFKGPTEYMMRFVVPLKEIGGRATIGQALDQRRQEGIVPIILDIDVAIDRDFKVEDSQIWTALEKMREKKNEIFFSILTEKATRLYS